MEFFGGSFGKGFGQGQVNGFDLYELFFILEEYELGVIMEELVIVFLESFFFIEGCSLVYLVWELKELVKELSSSIQGELVVLLYFCIVQFFYVMDSYVSECVKNKVYQLVCQYSF